MGKPTGNCTPREEHLAGEILLSSLLLKRGKRLRHYAVNTLISADYIRLIYGYSPQKNLQPANVLVRRKILRLSSDAHVMRVQKPLAGDRAPLVFSVGERYDID